jgi:hypothetical protein
MALPFAVQGLELLSSGNHRGIAVTKHDIWQGSVRCKVGAANLWDRLVHLIGRQELDLMHCPPTAYPGAGPLVSIEIEGTKAPARAAARSAVIGYHQRLVREPVSLLRSALTGKLYGKGIIVFDDGRPCFFAHI